MEKHKLRIIPVILIFLAVILGCKDNSTEKAEKEPAEESRYIVEIEAIDYAFKMPSEIKSGWVTFQFINMGKEVHYASIVKHLKDITQEQWSSSPGKEYMEMVGGFIFNGGPGYHSSGMKSEITVYLEPGSYNIFCEVKTAEGIEHRHLGMKKYFRVSEEKSGAPRPKANLTLTLKPIYIEADGSLETGVQTVQIVHTAEQLGLNLVRLNDTSTIKEALKFMDKFSMPTESMLVTGAESTGNPDQDTYKERKSYITVDLEPGDYAWMSQSYSGMGMIREFSVSGNSYTDKHSEYLENEMESIKVELTEQGLQMPEVLEPGRYEFKLDTESFGPDPDSHFVILTRLMEGKTKQDYIAYTKSRGPGVERLPKPDLGLDVPITYPKFEEDQALRVDLRAGKYVIACTNWRWKHQSKHIEKGEVASFEVK